MKLYVVEVRGSGTDGKCWSIRPDRMGVTDPTQVEEVIDLLRQSSMFQKCSKASLQKVSFSCLYSRLLNAHFTLQLHMPGAMHRVPGSEMTHPGILSTLYLAHIYESLRACPVSHAPATGRK